MLWACSVSSCREGERSLHHLLSMGWSCIIHSLLSNRGLSFQSQHNWGYWECSLTSVTIGTSIFFMWKKDMATTANKVIKTEWGYFLMTDSLWWMEYHQYLQALPAPIQDTGQLFSLRLYPDTILYINCIQMMPGLFSVLYKINSILTMEITWSLNTQNISYWKHKA